MNTSTQPKIHSVTLCVFPFFKSPHLRILFLFLALSGSLSAQQARTVTGTVLDEKGDPLVGAMISVDGTQNGTITGNGGTFTLRVPGERSVLIVSFYGYVSARETNLNNPTITLKPDMLGLEEVVAVGYGSQKAGHLTSAAVSVDVEAIKDYPINNLGAALKYQIPGLNITGGEARPGTGANITIRQAGGGEQPLFIIDDIVYYNNAASFGGGQWSGQDAFNKLDPNMIESITILKDGSAAIYGASASHGAIVVKTKRGRAGEVRISYSGSYTHVDAIDRAKTLDPYDFGVLHNRLAERTVEQTASINRQTGLYQADELESMKNMNYDWLKKAWHAAHQQRHNINMHGGTNTSSYFAGVGFSEQNSNLMDGGMTQWSFNAGVDTRLSSHFKISLRLLGDYGTTRNTFSKIGSENIENDYNFLFNTPRHVPWQLTGEDGKKYWNLRSPFTGTLTSSENNVALYNYFAMQELDNVATREPVNMNVNASVEYDFGWSRILNGLSFRVQYNKRFYNDISSQYGTYFHAAELRSRGGSGNHLWVDGGPVLDADYGGRLMHPNNINYRRLRNGDRILRDQVSSNGTQANFYANYARSFGLHDLSGAFVIERAESNQRRTRGYKDNVVPNFTEESNAATSTPEWITDRQVSGALSYVGQANYAYDDKYLLQLLYRTDASTKFAPENYWGSFWNIGLGWVISQEEWFDVSWIDYMKIRGTYAVTGSSNGFDDWGWQQRFSYEHDKGFVMSPNAQRSARLNMTKSPNRAAHWDHEYKHNLGVDLSFLAGRLSATVDGYFNRRRDMLVSRGSVMPWTVGGDASAENFGATDTFGGELSLSWHDRIGQVGYRISANTSLADNRIRKQIEPTDYTWTTKRVGESGNTGTWGYEATGILRTQAEVDAYVAELKAHAAAASAASNTTIVPSYLNQTDMTKIYPGSIAYRDIRGARPAGSKDDRDRPMTPDGRIDAGDQIQLAKHRLIGGFNLSLGADWKGLSVTAQFNAGWGGGAYKAVGSSPTLNNMRNNQNNYPVYWRDMYQAFDVLDNTGKVVAPANLDARWPNPEIASTTQVSSFWHIPTFRLNLTRLQIGYTLPQKWAEAVTLSSVRVNLATTNLISFYNPLPEKYVSPLARLSGYPDTRNVSLGVNISF